MIITVCLFRIVIEAFKLEDCGVTLKISSNLAVSETVFIGLQLQGRDEQFTGLPAVHEPSRDSLGGQDGIPTCRQRVDTYVHVHVCMINTRRNHFIAI